MPALPDQLSSPRGTPPTGARENRGHALIPRRLAPDANPLLRVAGGLALAGVLLGLSLLILTCCGFDAALYFSPAILVLSFAGGILTILAAKHSPSTETGPILASFFLATLALLGGVLELAVWLQWPILFSQHGQ